MSFANLNKPEFPFRFAEFQTSRLKFGEPFDLGGIEVARYMIDHPLSFLSEICRGSMVTCFGFPFKLIKPFKVVISFPSNPIEEII